MHCIHVNYMYMYMLFIYICGVALCSIAVCMFLYQNICFGLSQLSIQTDIVGHLILAYRECLSDCV